MQGVLRGRIARFGPLCTRLKAAADLCWHDSVHCSGRSAHHTVAREIHSQLDQFVRLST